jgi:uncharacterized membrane protein HdeD (DUF308 family)
MPQSCRRARRRECAAQARIQRQGLALRSRIPPRSGGTPLFIGIQEEWRMEAMGPGPGRDDIRQAVEGVARFWWLWLVFGVVWTLIAVTILQFDQASITTVGILIGAMFLATALQSFVVGAMVERHGWIYMLFGVLFLISGVVSLISPEDTFAAIADILGFLFLIVGIAWLVQAFMWREENELWWVGLIAAIMMIIIAFWTGGQFFIEKQYTLLVFAGIWALLQGVTDVVKAFQIRKLGKAL